MSHLKEHPTIIQVKDIEKVYPDGTRALRGISFTIGSGEFVTIMGPSGSGKSTLLNILGFLDSHSSGIYKFNGNTINDYSPDELARIRNKKMGFIFQMFNLLPRTSVLENVKLPLLYSDVQQSKWDKMAFNAIESVKLSHRIENYPAQLSGGERQRVAIARALINDPQIIFADEPTGNLDSVSGGIIMDIIQNLNNEGKTVVLITHETYAASHAERIIKIHDGIIIDDVTGDHHKKVKSALGK